MYPTGDIIDIPLTQQERELLGRGLQEWSGPASCTDGLAVAMGFDSLEDFFAQSRRVQAALAGGEPLSPTDWLRTLLATEIVFVSDVLGSGTDWSSATGFTDEYRIQVLRAVQRKILATTAGAPQRWLGAIHPRTTQ